MTADAQEGVAVLAGKRTIDVRRVYVAECLEAFVADLDGDVAVDLGLAA